MGALEEWIHRNIDNDEVVFSTESDMQRLADIAKNANIEGAHELAENVKNYDPQQPFKFELTSKNYGHHSAEEDEEAKTNLISEMIVAANAHMLEQLEARKGAVKTLEQGMEPGMLAPDDSPPQEQTADTALGETPTPSPEKKGTLPLDKNNPRWVDYLKTKGYNYGEGSQVYNYNNELQIEGSSDMTAMRKDYSDNYAVNETLGKAAHDTAGGAQADRGGSGQEVTQQNDEKRSTTPTPTPFPKEH